MSLLFEASSLEALFFRLWRIRKKDINNDMTAQNLLPKICFELKNQTLSCSSRLPASKPYSFASGEFVQKDIDNHMTAQNFVD